MRSLIPIAAIVASLATVTATATAIDIGPAVGGTAPVLAAVDASGKPRDLASVAGRNGTVLVFFRSAKWCPFCQRQLIELNNAAEPLAARGYGLAAISYDPPPALASFAARQAIRYPLLSDGGSRMIDAYGIRDSQYPVGNFAHGVPRPAIFVLDTRGVVRGKLAEDSYRNRPPVAAVLTLVDGLK